MNQDSAQSQFDNLSGLCGYLQDQSELNRYAIANQLHDEIGGLLVAARLNVAWLQEHLPSNDPKVMEHFKRLHEALRHGVEVKRRIVEDLRPTLLDNIGLYSALRWQMEKSCGAAKLPYTEHYPDEELSLLPEAGILVYRIVEQAIDNMIRHARATNAHLVVSETPESLLVSLQDDGVGMSAAQRTGADSFGIATMNYRATRLGGKLKWGDMPKHGTEVQLEFPLSKLIREKAA
jgi:signal transduction histidine kinase